MRANILRLVFILGFFGLSSAASAQYIQTTTWQTRTTITYGSGYVYGGFYTFPQPVYVQPRVYVQPVYVPRVYVQPVIVVPRAHVYPRPYYGGF